jgi:hypothetical protein
MSVILRTLELGARLDAVTGAPERRAIDRAVMGSGGLGGYFGALRLATPPR